MEPVERFARGTVARDHFENCAKVCITGDDAPDGAIILGRRSLMGCLRYHIDMEEPKEDSEGPPATITSLPKMYRIYFEHNDERDLQLPDIRLPRYSLDDEQFERAGGAVLNERTVGVTLHACPQWISVYYDECNAPNKVYHIRIGFSMPKRGVEEIPRNMRTPLQRNLGIPILMCMEFYREGVEEVLALGKGNAGFYEYYVDLSLSEYMISTTSIDIAGRGVPGSRPVRLYLPLAENQAAEIDCADEGRMSDAEFVSRLDGEIRLAGASSVMASLHVCAEGVRLFYDEIVYPSRSFDIRLGDSKDRKNKFIDEAEITDGVEESDD